jgi:hypothetical protein
MSAADPQAGRLRRSTPVGEYEDRDHGREQQSRLPQRSAGRLFGQSGLQLCLGQLLLAEHHVHRDTHHDGEQHGADGAGNTQLHAEHPSGEDDGQHVDGGAGVEERGRGPQPRSAHVDACEQWQHRAGAHGEDAARHRGDSVCNHLVGPRAEVLHDGALAHEHPDGAGDEERGHETQQHVLAGVPADQQ